MRHRNGGFKLGRNTSHRRALLRNLVTSIILNDRGLTVDIYPEMRKAVNMLAVHKTLDSQLYVMANLWSMERNLDDCLLQNDRGNIIESSVDSWPPCSVWVEVKTPAGLPAKAPDIHSALVPSKKNLTGAAMLPNRVGLPRIRPQHCTRSSCVA